MKRAFPYNTYRKKYKWYGSENDRLSKLNERGYRIKEHSSQPIDNEIQFYRQYTHGGGGTPYIREEEKPIDQIRNIGRELDKISYGLYDYSTSRPDDGPSAVSPYIGRPIEPDNSGGSAARYRSSSISRIKIKKSGPLDRTIRNMSKVNRLVNVNRAKTSSLENRMKEFVDHFNVVDSRLALIDSGMKEVREDIANVDRSAAQIVTAGKKYIDKRLKRLNYDVYANSAALRTLVRNTQNKFIKDINEIRYLVKGYQGTMKEDLFNFNNVIQAMFKDRDDQHVHDIALIDSLASDISNIRTKDLAGINRLLKANVKDTKEYKALYNNLKSRVNEFNKDLYGNKFDSTPGSESTTVGLINRVGTIHNIINELIKARESQGKRLDEVESGIKTYIEYYHSLSDNMAGITKAKEAFERDQNSFKESVNKRFKENEELYFDMIRRIEAVEALTRPGGVLNAYIDDLVTEYNSSVPSDRMDEVLDKTSLKSVLMDVIYDTRNSNVSQVLDSVTKAMNSFGGYLQSIDNRQNSLERFAQEILERTKGEFGNIRSVLEQLNTRDEKVMANITDLYKYRNKVSVTLNDIWRSIGNINYRDDLRQRASKQDLENFRRFVDYVNNKIFGFEQRFQMKDTDRELYGDKIDTIVRRLTELDKRFSETGQRDGTTNLINQENYVTIRLPDSMLNNIKKLNVMSGVKPEDVDRIIELYDNLYKNENIKPEDIQVVQEHVQKIRGLYDDVLKTGGSLLMDTDTSNMLSRTIKELSDASNRLRMTKKYKRGDSSEPIPAGTRVRTLSEREIYDTFGGDAAVINEMQRSGINEMMIQTMDTRVPLEATQRQERPVTPRRNDSSRRITDREVQGQLPPSTRREQVGFRPFRGQIDQFAHHGEGEVGRRSAQVYPHPITEEQSRRRRENIDGSVPHFNESN